MKTAIIILVLTSCIVIPFCYLIDFLIKYKIHLDTSKEDSKTWDYGNFEDFQEQFKKYKWNLISPNLFTSPWDSCSCSEYFTRFEGNGMVFGIVDYFYYIRALKKLSRKSNSKRKKGIWKEKLRVVK